MLTLPEVYMLANAITNAYKIQKLRKAHATRFLRILLGYKSCFSYIPMTLQYGCYCGAHIEGCQQPVDCLDDCCRSVYLMHVLFVSILFTIAIFHPLILNHLINICFKNYAALYFTESICDVFKKGLDLHKRCVR